MRRQLRSCFGRHEHVPVRIAEKSTAGIGTARSIVVVQSQHADGDHVVAVVCNTNPPIVVKGPTASGGTWIIPSLSTE